jgi:hypothetical protein
MIEGYAFTHPVAKWSFGRLLLSSRAERQNEKKARATAERPNLSASALAAYWTSGEAAALRSIPLISARAARIWMYWCTGWRHTRSSRYAAIFS